MHYVRNPAFVPAARAPIVNAMPGVSKAAWCRPCPGGADIFAIGWTFINADNSSQTRNHLAASRVDHVLPDRRLPPPSIPGTQDEQSPYRRRAVADGSTVRLLFTGAAVLLALACVPQASHGQGIVRGAQEGSYEGNRIAGPVGGAVGGVVGAGVGGAVGAVDGILGIPYHGRRHCRGYYDGHRHFHCYR